MRLNLQEILHTPGAIKPFQFSLDLSALDFLGLQPLTQPIQVAGQVTNQAGVLTLTGEADTTLSLSCDRCLRPIEKPLRIPVSFLLAEHLENEENDEILLLENGALDLDDLFTTAVVLGMDSKHLCSEDCKGLCPKCGVNLNTESCLCKPNSDPRLAALAQLLDIDE